MPAGDSGRLGLIEAAGHLRQLQTPRCLVDDRWTPADQHATNRPAQAPAPSGGLI